jgi:transglutaminase-like putative cysteine protease
VRLLVSESGEPVEVTVRLIAHDPQGSTWAIDHAQEWQQTTLRLDADGIMIEQSVTTPPLRITRASREQALAIDYRVMPDRELLVFPFDRELPPAGRLERIDVKLTWQDIPPAEFQLEDARQRLLSLEEVDGSCAAIVRLGRAAGSASDATRPLPRERFAATLAAEDFILPEDARIVATAAEIVGAETSARAAAQRICQWVSDYIRPEMIAETLSGPQVLERRVGKCSEYTTLFASLARAAGIPTRVVLGQRRFAGAKGDTWGGHMWNEVFVGEWIPVDASANEVGGSLDLLKFIHSDTVAGTQPLRWKLTRSLGVSIADVELRPVAAAAAATGLQGTTYTSAEYGFRVDLPDATWSVQETPAAGAFVLRLRPPDPDLGDSAMFHVTAFALPKGVAPKVILDARLTQQRKALQDVEVLRDEDAGVQGVASHRLTFGGVPKSKNSVPLRVSEVLLHHGETGVLVNLIANVELHEKYLAVLDRIVATVSFLE